MTAPSAFPTGASPFAAVAQPLPIPQRGTHVPAFYVRNPHAEPDTTVVTQQKVPLLGTDKQSFVVSQVALERRWAIGQDGEVMNQVDFAEKFKQVFLEYFEMLRMQGNPSAKFTGNIAVIPIPAVQYFVDWKVDPENDSEVLHMGYDPKATAGSKPESFVNKDGDPIAGARIDHIVEAYKNPKMRGSLTASEVEEAKVHLGEDGNATGGDIIAKLELLGELKESGDLTTEQYLAKVAALTGKPVAKPDPDPVSTQPLPDLPPATPGVVALSLCEKECKGARGKRMHEMNCAKCKAIVAGDAQTEGDST